MRFGVYTELGHKKLSGLDDLPFVEAKHGFISVRIESLSGENGDFIK